MIDIFMALPFLIAGRFPAARPIGAAGVEARPPRASNAIAASDEAMALRLLCKPTGLSLDRLKTLVAQFPRCNTLQRLPPEARQASCRRAPI